MSKNRLREAESVLHKVAVRNKVKLPEFTLVVQKEVKRRTGGRGKEEEVVRSNQEEERQFR